MAGQLLSSLIWLTFFGSFDELSTAELYVRSDNPHCAYSAGAFCIKDLDFVFSSRRITRHGLVQFTMHERPFPDQVVTVTHDRGCRNILSNTVRMTAYNRRFRFNNVTNIRLKFRIGSSPYCDVSLISPFHGHESLMGLSVAVGQMYACSSTSCDRDFASVIPPYLRIFGMPR